MLRTLLDTMNVPRSANHLIYDLGCGTGGNFSWLREFGEVHGLDISDEALRFCRKRGIANIRSGSVMRLPWGDASADGVALIDVLYHEWVSDDSAALKEAARVLKPGGWLIFNTSACESLRGTHDDAVMTARRHHRRELRRQMLESGFEIRKVSYWNFFLFPATWMLRKFRKSAGSELRALPRGVDLAFYVLLQIENFWLRIGSLPAGTSLACFAVKKL